MGRYWQPQLDVIDCRPLNLVSRHPAKQNKNNPTVVNEESERRSCGWKGTTKLHSTSGVETGRSPHPCRHITFAILFSSQWRLNTRSMHCTPPSTWSKTKNLPTRIFTAHAHPYSFLSDRLSFFDFLLSSLAVVLVRCRLKCSSCGL